MRKIIIINCLIMFFLSLTTVVYANTESESLVNEGRALLCNNGDPEYSKLIEANEKFEAAYNADNTDQKANFFYTVTRMLVFLSQEGDGTNITSLSDIMEAFGIEIDIDSFDENNNNLFDIFPVIYGKYNPPETIPNSEEIQTFLTGQFLFLLNAVIISLDEIDDSFNITLTAAETGDDDVEIDYGDVLMLKTALYALKTVILFLDAYDLNLNIRDIIAIANAGVLQIQRDILDKYPDFLKLRNITGAASLLLSKEALLAGIATYREAYNFIINETDPQENDLFYFESTEDINGANFVLTQLTELENSLIEDRPAEFTDIEERWIITDNATGKRIEIEIEKDVNGNLVCGHAWGLDGCEFLFCNERVEEFTISETQQVTIKFISLDWYHSTEILTTLTGTLNGSQIINGQYNQQTNNEIFNSGSFTGQLVNTEIETYKIDVNYIFGNGKPLGQKKSPLDIRAIMPEFGDCNKATPGTFPPFGDSSPVLNNIFPDIQTNDDLTQELDLEPCDVLNPAAQISGEISCPAHNNGNIFIWACDKQYWDYANKLGGVCITAPGNYTIPNLPVGIDIYLFALWDVDNNGIATFGDYWGKSDPITTIEGNNNTVNFAINSMIDENYAMNKPYLYRVFGSNSFDFQSDYYCPASDGFNWNDSKWTFIGEGKDTQTFDTSEYYKTILIIWGRRSVFNFDSFEDLTAGTAFATNADGTSSGYEWEYFNLTNSDANTWNWCEEEEPDYFKGFQDGKYAVNQQWYDFLVGFSLFTMPDDDVSLNESRQLRITLVSNKLAGDVNGDNNVNLADAIIAIKLLSNLNPQGINSSADVNGDGKIGLAEIIFILQHMAEIE